MGIIYWEVNMIQKVHQVNFVTCQNCNGSGVTPNSTAPCKNCCGFGTVIVYEENEHDYESKANC